MKLAELDSDSFGKYVSGFDSMELLVKKHRKELDEVVSEAMERAKKQPIPPNIIIRCSDGDRMSLPFTYEQYREMCK